MPATKPTARSLLQRSHLETSQREAMGQDYDPEAIKLQLKGTIGIELQEAITDAEVERTIEGASTLTIHIVDHDRKLLRSNRLHNRADVKVDGLWFRLVSVNKQEDMLDLVFETREVAVLRQYNKLIRISHKTERFSITRAKFILRLLREVKEFKIPWVIPELERIQAIEEDMTDQQTRYTGANSTANATSRGQGIPHGAGHKQIYRPSGGAGEPHAQRTVPWLTCKKVPLTNYQIDCCNKVLDQGVRMNVKRKLLVMSIMCGIQEANLGNPKQPAPGTQEYKWSNTSAGFFQEIAGQGQSEAERRDITASARRFFTGLQAAVHQNPGMSYGDLIQSVQRSAYEGDSTYGAHRAEAEKIVTAYGAHSPEQNNMNPQDDSGAPPLDYHFYRGHVTTLNGKQKWTKENSWNCIQRLADEVNWRAFFISGTFYFMSEDQLFKSKPAAIIDENSKGIVSIDGEYDVGKNTSEVTITCHMGQWACPPGSTVQIINSGPFNGKWLVSHVRRSLFNNLGEITVKKPRPRLPEPAGDTQLPVTYSALTGNATPPREPHEEPAKFGTGDVRENIVAAARLALKHGMHYDATEPGRSSGIVNKVKPPNTPKRADCSSFATWCYWAAGAPDPNGLRYSYVGNTSTMAKHGRRVSLHDARPGDLALYAESGVIGSGPSSHVAVCVGNGKAISVGGDPDPTLVDVNYRGDLVMIRSYVG